MKKINNYRSIALTNLTSRSLADKFPFPPNPSDRRQRADGFSFTPMDVQASGRWKVFKITFRINVTWKCWRITKKFCIFIYK
ncbi:hypothetical protein ES705_08935 [subsurface metagenome]